MAGFTSSHERFKRRRPDPPGFRKRFRAQRPEQLRPDGHLRAHLAGPDPVPIVGARSEGFGGPSSCSLVLYALQFGCCATPKYVAEYSAKGYLIFCAARSRDLILAACLTPFRRAPARPRVRRDLPRHLRRPADRVPGAGRESRPLTWRWRCPATRSRGYSRPAALNLGNLRRRRHRAGDRDRDRVDRRRGLVALGISTVALSAPGRSGALPPRQASRAGAQPLAPADRPPFRQPFAGLSVCSASRRSRC